MSGLVLIIDAEERFAQRLAETLSRYGLECMVTGDGKDGLEKAQVHIPQAIILCVELAGMSGYFICTKLKRDPTLKQVPIFITSADANQETFESHMRLKTRAEEYLKKPFDPEELIPILARYLPLQTEGNEEDLSVEAAPPETLNDDEVFADDDFNLEEPVTDQAGASLDDALEALSASAIDLGGGLMAHSGALERTEDDEVMTTVGVVPTAPGRDRAAEEIRELRQRLRDAEDLRLEAERARDEALANERAAQAQLNAISTTSLPHTAASGGRDVVALKKELNAKERELLELRDKVGQRDREVLGLRDSETELEGRIVQLEEEREALDRTRIDLEGRLVHSETRSQELERRSADQIRELNRRLDEAAARESNLEGELGLRSAEIAQLSQQLRGRESDLEQLTRQARALNNELTRVTNELAASQAESDSLRVQLAQTQGRLEDSQARSEHLEAELQRALAELEATRQTLAQTEQRLSGAMQRIQHDQQTQAKARQALEIALALLQQPAYQDGNADDDLLELQS